MKKYLTLTFLLLSACGSPDRARPDAPPATPDAPSSDSNGSGSSDGCADPARHVYVVDQNNTFSTFDPVTKTFTDLGTLNCPASDGAAPFSMGVDRNAIAWVLYNDGSLFRLDTTTLACTATTWQPTPDLFVFGMGFSTDTSGGTTDTLYVAGTATHAGATTGAFASLDTTAFTATNIATIPGFPELTGTGSAELWAWYPSTMGTMSATTPHADQLDKTTGAVLQTFPLSTLAGQPDAYAFAFWGGHFWIFLDRDNLMNTTVFELDPTTGQIASTTMNTGRVIVGAGVSTCAPILQ
jgi:hypothetical protein